MNRQVDSAVPLLWTGGWDSTYRLLYLLLVDGKAVQPIYLVEYQRKSALHEVASMARIRERLLDLEPRAASALRPTRLFLVHEIAPCPAVTARFESLSSRFRLGSQFEWLSRLAEEHRLEGLELAIEKNAIRPRDPVFAHLGRFLREDEGSLRLSDTVSDEDLLLFRYFRFPLYSFTKIQMLASAKQHGFYDLMLESWFCYRPRNGRPCGVCHPCRDVMEEGFAFRIPPLSRARYRFGSLLNRGKRLVAAGPAR